MYIHLLGFLYKIVDVLDTYTFQLYNFDVVVLYLNIIRPDSLKELGRYLHMEDL